MQYSILSLRSSRSCLPPQTRFSQSSDNAGTRDHAEWFQFKQLKSLLFILRTRVHVSNSPSVQNIELKIQDSLKNCIGFSSTAPAKTYSPSEESSQASLELVPSSELSGH